MGSRIPVYELEHGIVTSSSNNETLWTVFTFTFSTVGMSLSTIALLLLILTAALFVEWRKSYKNQLLVQFMLARFFYTLIRYICDIQKLFGVATNIKQLVTLDVLLLIYSEMALVTWMFIFSRQMYLSLVKVFDLESTSIWKVSICAWVTPGVIAFLLYMLYYVQYNKNILHFLLYMMIAKWPVLIANAVLLILVLKSILVNNMNAKNNVKIIVVMMVMIFGFCFQQMFIDMYKIIYVTYDELSVVATALITSNILAMFHCAFSIMFWLFGNKNTRTLWKFQKKVVTDKVVLNVRFSA